MSLKILNNNQKKELLKKLNEQFGIKEIPPEISLIQPGNEKIFAFSGDLEMLKRLEKLKINIAGTGNYILNQQENQFRLSIEGTHLFKSQITKNIFDLNSEQAEKWMYGSEILLDDFDKSKFIDETDEELISINNKSIKPADKIKNYVNNKKIIANEGKQQIRVGNSVSQGGAKIKRGFLIMKYKNDFLGTGKASENKIGNFIPKSRRLKISPK